MEHLNNLKVELGSGKPHIGLCHVSVLHDGTDHPWRFYVDLNGKGGLREFDVEDAEGNYTFDVIHPADSDTEPLERSWREQILNEIERVVDEHVIANGGKL